MTPVGAAAQAVYQRIVDKSPKLQRGMVWCLACGKTRHIDAASALQHGWPRCCDRAMTIDAPDERDV